MASALEYSKLPERAAKAIENFLPDDEAIEKRVKHFDFVKPRIPDHDGQTEVLGGVTFTHHFVTAPGDYETVEWH